jgi:type IV pilus assembly protein PilF
MMTPSLRAQRSNPFCFFVCFPLILYLTACTNINNPNTTAANFNVQLGMGYLQRGQIERAKPKLLLALQQAPNWSPALDAMALYSEKTGNITAARQYHLQALAIDFNNGSVQNNYGVFLCRVGELKQAETHFLHAIADPNYLNTAEAYENAGLCALKIPDQQKAIIYFEKALLHAPGRAKTVLELGELNYKQGHYRAILASINRYLYVKEGATDRNVLYLGIRAAEQLNDKQAIKYYQSFADTD